MTRKQAIEILKDLWRTKYSIYLEADIRKALEMAIQALEQEPKTQMVDKSNFDIEQYKMDLQCAYDCGRAGVEPKKENYNANFLEFLFLTSLTRKSLADYVIENYVPMSVIKGIKAEIKSLIKEQETHFDVLEVGANKAFCRTLSIIDRHIREGRARQKGDF